MVGENLRTPAWTCDQHYRIASLLIDMIDDRLVTLQPHGGMTHEHASFMGLHRDTVYVIDGIGSTEQLDASGVYAMRAKRNNHKVEFAVAKVTPTVLAGENGRHKV